MRSNLFYGDVQHTRFWPVEHRLRYPLYLFGIDLDDLGETENSLWLFGLNRRRVEGIRSRFDAFNKEKT